MGWPQINPLLPERELALLVAAAILVAGVLAWLSSRRLTTGPRVLGVLLRMAAVAGLGVLAFNPGRWRHPDEDRIPTWAILVDRSASMAAPDVGAQSRWQAAVKLGEEAAALCRAEGVVVAHPFARDLEPAAPPATFAARPADGEGTGLWQAGAALLGEHPPSGGPLAAVFLFSDGIQNVPGGMGDFARRARARGTPVFAVAFGAVSGRRDLTVRASRAHAVAFPGQKVALGARLRNEGLEALRPTVRLLDEQGRELASTAVTVPPDQEAEATMRIDAGEPGVRLLHFASPAFPGEASALNNEADCVLVTLPGRLRVLTAEGVPFWDSKFLVQRLRQEANFDITSVYRLANERFFRVATAQQEAMTADADVFPDDVASLQKYDVIVIGAGAEFLLTPKRAQLLAEFVRDRGGAVVFARGKPYDRPPPALAALEPVEWGPPLAGAWRLAPTPAGEEAGLFAGEIPGEKAPLWEQLPPLSGVHAVERLRPFTRVLAEGSAGPGRAPVPLVVSRRYGKGLVVSVNAEGFWQWAFFPSVAEARALHGEFWVQLLQWAASYSEFLPGQNLALRLDQAVVAPGAPVRASVLQREPGQPAEVVVRVRPLREDQSGAWRDFPAAPGADAGAWEALLAFDQPGGYRVEAVDRRAPEGAHPVTQLTVLPPPTEKDDLAPRREFLRQLAEESGGRLIEAKDIPAVIAECRPAAHPPGPANGRWESAWPRGWLLLALAGLLAGEWVLRRRGGIV